MTRALYPHASLPSGPEVVQVADESEERGAKSGERGANSVERGAEVAGTAEAVERVLADWKAKGLCKPSEVVIIGRRRLLKDSSLGAVDRVAGLELADYQENLHGKLAYIGAHRSKGMDFLGVILIDFPSFEELAPFPEAADRQEAYFLGASRARQLLAVVCLKS